jgi:signal peptidase
MRVISSDLDVMEETPSLRRPGVVGRLLRDLLLVLGVIATVALALLIAIVHIHFMRVASPSMEPTIRVGDVVVVRQQAAMELRPGQVVVLPVPDEGGAMYVHRITNVRLDDGQVFVTTKGDANPAPDPWELRIDSADVPLVVGQIPMPGVLAGSSGAGLTQLLVALLLAVIAAPLVTSIIRRTRAGTRLRAQPVRLSDHRHR